MRIFINFHCFRGLPSLEKSQIRLLVYKDHDKRGDKYVLFDSKTAEKDDPVEKVCLKMDTPLIFSVEISKCHHDRRDYYK